MNTLPSYSGEALVHCEKLVKQYGNAKKGTAVFALNNLSVDIYPGQFTAIMGPSGSGKSTLMHMLAGIDRVTSGEIWVSGEQITHLSDKKLTYFRRNQIGFVFQAYNLIPTLTAQDNITIPQKLGKNPVDKTWFMQLVQALNIDDRLTHLPHELSGGQQQRVALARALLGRPSLLVADEPTGNLDSKSSHEVLKLLRESVDKLGQTVIMVTHDANAASLADRVLVLRDGKITNDISNPTVSLLNEVTK